MKLFAKHCTSDLTFAPFNLSLKLLSNDDEKIAQKQKRLRPKVSFWPPPAFLPKMFQDLLEQDCQVEERIGVAGIDLQRSPQVALGLLVRRRGRGQVVVGEGVGRPEPEKKSEPRLKNISKCLLFGRKEESSC